MRHHGQVIVTPAPPVETNGAPTDIELSAPALVIARDAVAAELGRSERVGDYLGAVAEDEVAVTASFAATERGYLGWRWSVTLAVLDRDHPTVSEVTLLPGPGALTAPAWVPWSRRVRPEDLGVGDLLPTPADDPRLVPAYVASDDPAVEELAFELGFGRVRVMSRDGRLDLAERWHEGAFGPADDTAVQAPGPCLSCGFYLPLAGLLGTRFGVCGNELAPAEGHVVDLGYGCGAHSEVLVDLPLRSAATESVIDELQLDVHLRESPADPVDIDPS